MSVIEEKIAAFKRAYFGNELVKGLIRFVGITFMVALLAIALESLGRFTSEVRFWIFWTILGTAGILMGRYLIWPLGRWLGWWSPLNHRRIAEIIARKFPGADDPLLSALEFGGSNQSGLHKAALDQAIARLQPLRFRQAINWRATYRLWPILVVPVGVFLILLAGPATRHLLDGGERIVAYDQAFLPPAPFRFVLENDSLRVARGDDFKLRLRLEGQELPASVVVRSTGQTYRMIQEGDGFYKVLLPSVKEDRSFRFQAGPYRSSRYDLSVFDRPGFDGLQLEVVPPPYTGLRPKVLPFKPQILVPEGSKVRWKVATHPNSYAFMNVGEQKVSFKQGSLDSSIMRPLNYRLGIENDYQQMWISPKGKIAVRKDKAPQVQARLAVDSSREELLLLQSLDYQDDYGISAVKRIVQGRDSVKRLSLAVSDQGRWTTMTPLNEVLKGLQGEVEVYFAVYDNDGINGPKMTRTKGFFIKQPSEAEREARREQAFRNAQQSAQSLRQKRQEMDKAAEELREDLMMDDQLGWKEQQKLKDLLREMKEALKATEKMKDQVKKATKKKDDSADAYEKRLEELTEEEKEMEKLKEEIEKLSESLNKEKLEKKLQELQKENKQRLRQEERMEKVLEDLKRQRDILKTAKQLQELGEKQEALSKEKKSGERQQQKEQMDKARKALEKMQELQKESDSFSEAMEESKASEKGRQAEEQMKEGLEKLQKGKSQEANPEQKEAGEKLQELSKDMQSALSKMQQNGLEVNMKSLRRILGNLEVFSEGVESAGKEIRELEKGDPRYRALLKEQERLAQGAKVIEDSLTLLAERAPQVEEKVFEELEKMQGNLKQAQAALQETERNKAANEHRFSMMAANELALLLDESMQQMMSMMAMQKPGKQNCQKPGGKKPKPGMGQKLDQMGKKIQRMQQGQKEGGKKGNRGLGGKELVKILSEQEQLRKSLQEMAEKAKGKGRKGDLQKAAEEMEEVEEDLAQGRESNYRERLQEIKTRLLESEKAELKRKKKEQRQAEEAQNLSQVDAPAWFQGAQKVEKGQEAIRSTPLDLTRFYKERSITW